MATLRIPYVKILGYGSGAYSYAFVTQEPSTLPSSGWDTSTTIPALLRPPNVFGIKLDALQRIGSASDVSFQLLFDGTAGSAEVGGLVQSDGLPLSDGSGGYVKTSQYETHTTTTINVHDSGSISNNDYVWIAGEVMRVTGTTSTTLTVTRAQRDTWARPLPYQSISSGTPVYADPPTVYGLAVEIGTIDGTTAAADVYWRGFVSSVSVNGTAVNVKARSLLGYLKDIEYTPPQGIGAPRLRGSIVPADSVNAGQLVGTIGGFGVDVDQYGDPDNHASVEWSYCRVFDDADRWVTVKCSHDRTEGNQAVYGVDLVDADSDVVQCGEGDTVYYFDGDVDQDRYRYIQRVLQGATRVEYAQRVATASLESIGSALIAVNAIAGTSAMLPTAWLDLGSAFLTADVINLWNGLVNLTDHYPPSYQGKLLDYISDVYLDPVFVGISEDSGELRYVDWVPDIARGESVTVDANEHASAAYTFQLKASEATPVVALRQALKTRGTEEYVTSIPALLGGFVTFDRDIETQNQAIIISELGVYANAWTDLEWVNVIGYSRGSWESILRRARAVVDLYDRSLPALSIQCRPTTDVESIRVGDLIRVSRSDLPTSAGVRGSDNPRGLVTERSVNLLTGQIDLRVLLIDWYASQLARGVWGPAAIVQSWKASTNIATIGTNDYSTSTATGDLPASDAEAFGAVLTTQAASVSVDLLDETGDYRDTGTLTAATGTALTVTNLTVTPQANDIFVLSDSSTVASSLLSKTITSGPVAWLADSSGDVRGGTVAGRVYS